jgi:hypothetical protein
MGNGDDRPRKLEITAEYRQRLNEIMASTETAFDKIDREHHQRHECDGDRAECWPIYFDSVLAVANQKASDDTTLFLAGMAASGLIRFQ